MVKSFWLFYFLFIFNFYSVTAEKKNTAYKWTHTVQTHVVQGSVVYLSLGKIVPTMTHTFYFFIFIFFLTCTF